MKLKYNQAQIHHIYNSPSKSQAKCPLQFIVKKHFLDEILLNTYPSYIPDNPNIRKQEIYIRLWKHQIAANPQNHQILEAYKYKHMLCNTHSKSQSKWLFVIFKYETLFGVKSWRIHTRKMLN